MPRPGLAALILLACLCFPLRAGAPWMDSSMGLLQGELTARFGPGQRVRIRRGLAQVARFWRPGDGGAGEFETFARAQFAVDKDLDALFGRLEGAVASLEGHLLEIGRDFRAGSDLGPPLPIDPILDGYDPAAHVGEDCFQNKLAFAVLLNFPLTTLEERVRDGGAWTGRQWAEARLADRFRRRVPAEVNQAAAEASAAADRYIAGDNIRMGLPPGRSPRDEIRARYAEGKAGLPRQREIQHLLERIVTQTLPADPEPGARYQMLLQVFQAARRLDPYSPMAPTRLARSFDQELQLPEARVQKLLEAVCASPLVARTAGLIRDRLGRRLEPFDLWYDGFRPGAGLREADLDGRVRKLELSFALDQGEHPLMAGTPSPAFTQALAFVSGGRAMAGLDGFWSAYRAAGAAMVDIAVWHWLYQHPDAAATELEAAVAAIAGDVWNRHYAPVFGQKDCVLLASCGRMITGGLCLPAYPIGRMIAAQIEARIRPGETFERCARLGRLTPDLWMLRATGSPLGPEALLASAEAALKSLGH